MSPSPKNPRPSTDQPKSGKGRFCGWRGWLLRLSLLILSPILFFGLLEAGLRLGGYGYPTGFFLGPDANGTCRTNDHFGWRFFPRSLAREPHPCALSAKPADTVRIFVLGGSAAMGTPDPAFSLGRVLGVMLRQRYPDMRFEVVNGAMTAISSHVAREIARDCAAREPDLFVVYMGNNDVTGPYGPGTVFQQWSPSPRIIRASLWAKSTRVGQLLGDVVECFGGNQGSPGHWRGMGMFLNNPVPADDPRLMVAYDNYRRNLADICDIARRAGAGVVLSTVAVNLRDCPPLASLHRSDLTSEDLAKWDMIYKVACELEANNRWLEAIERYEEAAKIDGRFAELHFRIGQCLMMVGRFAEARTRFESARDLDVLRFRADSRINAIIRELAGKRQAFGVRLADAERTLAASDPDSKGIAGGSLFYEHVHMTFPGTYLIARSVLDQVCKALPQLSALGAQGEIPSRQRCAELLALTSWDKYQLANKMLEMTSKPPFTNQLDHVVRQALARNRVEGLYEVASTPQVMQASWRIYQAALDKTPDDWLLHHHFAMLAMQRRKPEVAVEHLRIAVKSVPWHASMQGNLGNALAAQGRADEAIAHFQKALEINPNEDVAHYNLGNVLAGRKQFDNAIDHYRKALEIKPDYEAAHFNLANVLAGQGKVDEAITHYRKAIEIQPDDAQAHSNLGVVLAKLGRVAEAIGHFQKALKIMPGDVNVRRNLEAARRSKK